MITAIITHYYDIRIRNLQPIVHSLVNQVDEILIWNNDKPLPDGVMGWLTGVANVHVIDSAKNYGCQGRFMAMKYTQRDHDILFHDNDVIASVKSVAKLREATESQNGDIVTGTGEWRVFNGEAFFITRGQFELVPRLTLNKILQEWKNDERSLHDDIWLSVTSHKLGITRRRIPISWKNFMDHVGFWRETPNFEKERQRVFEWLMRGDR